MIDNGGLFYKGVISENFMWDDEDEDQMDVTPPPNDPILYGKTAQIEKMIFIIDAKHARKEFRQDDEKASPPIGSETELHDMWARIGYVVVIGLAIAVLGTTLRFVYTGPIPFALAA